MSRSSRTECLAAQTRLEKETGVIYIHVKHCVTLAPSHTLAFSDDEPLEEESTQGGNKIQEPS